MEAIKDVLLIAWAMVLSVVLSALGLVVMGAFIALPFVAIGVGLAAGAKAFMWVFGI
ncbi:hypothetical protein GOL95_09955 [Sinorhizobium medicae]|nr:hypothetical protein [Sinorhizobium medicae]